MLLKFLKAKKCGASQAEHHDEQDEEEDSPSLADAGEPAPGEGACPGIAATIASAPGAHKLASDKADGRSGGRLSFERRSYL